MIIDDARHGDPWQRATDGGWPVHDPGGEIQAFGTVRTFPIALAEDVRLASTQVLNQLLADSQVLYGLYKKHHWSMRGATFHQLHLLLDHHAGEQLALVDAVAERVQTLGGIAVGDLRLAAELTAIPRAPDGVEAVPAMLSRLLDAHERIISGLRSSIEGTASSDDTGTHDLLTSTVLVTHERQVWFLAEHLVDLPLTQGGA